MSAEIAKIEPAPAPAHQVNDGAVVLTMIDKLIARPDVPVEKLEQMFELHRKVQADAARREYTAALSRMLADMPTIAERGKIAGNVKDGNQVVGKQTQSTYALWEDVNEAIRPVLSKHEFALTFRITQPTADRVSVTAVLSHAGGHAEETTFSLPIDASGGKNNVQGWASSVSYGKRYTAFAMLNIAGRGEDDDGKKAGEQQDKHATPEEIEKLIIAAGADKPKLLAHFSVEELADLTGKQRDQCRSMLLAKKAHMQKAAKA
jgi:hypothetical protein